MSIATWYTHQYHSWNRTRRLAQTPFLARTGTNTSQAAVAMAQQLQNGQIVDPTNPSGKDKKSSEPLFGPSIGPVSNGPSWTLSSEKKVVTDELTPDIVSGWIEKSKEPSQPTTTLQALVNLKRPTLRLSPLSSVQDDPSMPNGSDLHHHGLEFEYDCDAPKCGIYVHVHLPKTHPDAPSTSSHHSLAKLLVFETVVDGGFGNRLKLEEGAMLELGRFEHTNAASNGAESPQNALSTEPSTSGDLSASQTPSDGPNGQTGRHNRRRFTHFHFRKRSHNRSISGPALAVVDAEPHTAQEGPGKTKDGKEELEEGVKVTIRLAALDEQGTELASPNEQITYLHIVRFGQKAEAAEGEDSGEDTRPWVVKVVKREATIGPHTFHLHEIFGLTSTSTHQAPPTAPPPVPTVHTYPPDEKSQVETAAISVVAEDESPQSECLLCLSSPREVVLLPCRHLVACKDCALNMVEFGAGGNITQAVEPATGDEGTANGGATGGQTGGNAAAVPATPIANQRRKRKAKGWFCPVCRQPYTSMLRLTTIPPSMPESKEGENSGTEDEGMPPLNETTVNSNNTNNASATTEVRSGGLLGGALRPGFLRGLSLSRNQPVVTDVENQIQTAA
ncbi:hypothetical protein CPB84DRAFT_1713539 [Gymnopilus junonius]|uniref:RING-type domain-containing protein n=1 Tax=Gymnopilus junonius TaxID=109634 RepID=A0A9P5THT3_GYMJU|nr:hypothetical protein CPB84DRAFT_1713539 [Gymnopilus junonius]